MVYLGDASYTKTKVVIKDIKETGQVTDDTQLKCGMNDIHHVIVELLLFAVPAIAL